jgi:hypothetical protein
MKYCQTFHRNQFWKEGREGERETEKKRNKQTKRVVSAC